MDNQQTELDFILDRVRTHDEARTEYKLKAEKWVEMWKLNPGFKKTLTESIAEGMEQVVIPTPFNVVNLSQRLLSSTPKINVIPQDVGSKESEEYADLCQKWLTAMWRQVNRVQRRNVLSDNIWNALVYGRFVFNVRWIKDQLPELQRKNTFPISITTLPPTNVGIVQGPYGTEFAYHKYESTLLDVIRRWPELKNAKSTTRLYTLLQNYEAQDHKTETQPVEVIDYWAMEEDGSIWNAVLVEDEFAKPYKVTSYPYVPIICGRGDYAVGIGDEYDGLSILHSIDGLWQYQCRLQSQLATGLMWYFFPHFLISNENNTPVEDLNIKPMGIDQVPPGTKVDQVSMSPNVPLAEAVRAQLDLAIQQSTYPDVMFGMMPADLKSSYGIALLTDAANGRIKNFQESLEMTIEHVNELCLALVEKFGGTKGVDIWGVTEHNEKYRLTLSKKHIGGVYANEVKITPAMPTDDLQKVVQGTQLADKHYISQHQLREQYLSTPSPADETRRIALEEFMQSDEMRNYRLRKAAEDYFGKEALTMMFGTPLMPPPPAGYEWQMNESGAVEMVKTPPQNGMPPMDGAMAPPGGLPEAPMGPPDGSGMMPPGGGAMPPGAPLQPPGVAGPMGGGIPPQLAGQIEGENLGQDPALDPMLMDMLLQTQGSQQDIMNQTVGIQP